MIAIKSIDMYGQIDQIAGKSTDVLPIENMESLKIANMCFAYIADTNTVKVYDIDTKTWIDPPKE